MRTIKVTIHCDICHENITGGDYRTETIKDENKNITQFHYCIECFNAHSYECDVCGDNFVNYRVHREG